MRICVHRTHSTNETISRASISIGKYYTLQVKFTKIKMKIEQIYNSHLCASEKTPLDVYTEIVREKSSKLFCMSNEWVNFLREITTKSRAVCTHRALNVDGLMMLNPQ